MSHFNLGRSVFNPRWNEDETAPPGTTEAIMAGIEDDEAEGVEMGQPPWCPYWKDRQLSGGFMKKMGKKSRLLQVVAPGTPALLDGIGEDDGEDPDELAGIWLGALMPGELQDRVQKLLTRDGVAADRIKALSPMKSEAVVRVVKHSGVPKLLERLQSWAKGGKAGGEGLLMVVERRMSAIEAVLSNKESDPIQRPLSVEENTAMLLYRSKMKDMRSQAREARVQAKAERTPSYYGHQETAFMKTPDEMKRARRGHGFGHGWHRGMAQRSPLAGVNMGDNIFNYLFRSTPMSVGDYNERVAKDAKAWADLKVNAGALGYRQNQALEEAAAKMPLSKYKTYDEAIKQLEWDVNHHPTIQDIDTLKELEARIPTLTNLVSAMVASPPAPTQDGENARALEFMQAELDRQIAEKKALLDTSRGLFGIPWTYWTVGGISAAALGGLYFLFGGKSPKVTSAHAKMPSF